MRKISANYIFPVSSAPLKNGILVLNEKNYIIDIIDTKGEIKEIQNLEFYSGVIIPGFIDVFTLLNFASFSKTEFQNCLHFNFNSALKEILVQKLTTPNTIQRGINQLEAYGTVATADYNINNEYAECKSKSKLCFTNINLSQSNTTLQIPNFCNQLKNNESILINGLILDKIKNFKPSKNLMNRYCVGTGSLSTHLKLSVFEELKTLQKFLTEFTLWELIKWGTSNGAKHLHIDSKFGSLEIGKKPGLNLLTHLDYINQKFTPKSELKILI